MTPPQPVQPQSSPLSWHPCTRSASLPPSVSVTTSHWVASQPPLQPRPCLPLRGHRRWCSRSHRSPGAGCAPREQAQGSSRHCQVRVQRCHAIPPQIARHARSETRNLSGPGCNTSAYRDSNTPRDNLAALPRPLVTERPCPAHKLRHLAIEYEKATATESQLDDPCTLA